MANPRLVFTKVPTETDYLGGGKIKLSFQYQDTTGRRVKLKKKHTIKLKCAHFPGGEVAVKMREYHNNYEVKFKTGVTDTSGFEITLDNNGTAVDVPGASGVGGGKLSGFKLYEKPRIRFETRDALSRFNAEEVTLDFKVEPRARKSVKAKVKCDLLAKEHTVSLSQSTTKKVKLKPDLTQKDTKDIVIEPLDAAKLMVQPDEGSTQFGVRSLTALPFPEVSFDPTNTVTSDVTPTPALKANEVPAGTAKVRIKVDGKIPADGLQLELGLDEGAFKGKKKVFKHTISRPSGDPESGTHEVPVEFVAGMTHASKMTLTAKQRCRVKAGGEPTVKVVPPTVRHTEISALLIEHGEKAKLEAKLNYAAPWDVSVKLGCTAFGGDKTLKVRKGSDTGFVELKLDETKFAQPQDVSIKTGDATKYLVESGKDKRKLQAAPEASFAEAWITPAEGPYTAGPEGKIKISVQLNGPAPDAKSKVLVKSAAFVNTAGHEVEFGPGKGENPETTEEIELQGTTAEVDVTLEAPTAGANCWTKPLSGKKAKKIKVVSTPVGTLAEGDEWLSLSGQIRAGDKGKVKVLLNSKPVGNPGKFKLQSPAFEADVVVPEFTADADPTPQEVEVTFKNTGSHTVTLVAADDKVMVGKHASEKVKVLKPRTVSIKSIEPHKRLYHQDKTKVTLKLSEKATAAETIAKLKLVNAKGGDDFSQAEVEVATLEGEDLIELEVQVDKAAIADGDTLSAELIDPNADAAHPHALPTKEASKKKEVPIHPFPKVVFSEKPFVKLPAKKMEGQVPFFVFSANEEPEVRVKLDQVAPQDGAKAKLTCANVFEGTTEYLVEFPPGERKASKVVCLKKDPGGDHKAKLKVEPGKGDDPDIFRCQGLEQINLLMSTDAKINLVKENWVTPDGPLQKDRDELELQLQLLGTLASTEEQHVQLKCSAFKESPFTVKIPASEWQGEPFKTPKIPLGKTVRSSLTVELVKPAESETVKADNRKYELGDNAKQKHEVKVPRVYFASRITRNAMSPYPKLGRQFLVDDKTELEIELSKKVQRPESDTRTAGLVKIGYVTVKVESESYEKKYDLKVKPDKDLDAKVKVVLEKIGKTEVRLHLPDGDPPHPVALGKVKHHSFTVKAAPEVRFDNKYAVKPAEKDKALHKKKHATDITKEKASDGTVTWGAFVRDEVLLTLRLTKFPGQQGAGAAITCADFPAVAPGEYRQVDFSSEYPGDNERDMHHGGPGELEKAKYGQIYAVSFSEGNKVVAGWEGLETGDLNADDVVFFNGKAWVKLTKKIYPFYFKKEKKKAEVTVRIEKPGDNVVLNIEHMHGCTLFGDDKLNKVNLKVKDGVIRFPDQENFQLFTVDADEDKFKKGHILKAVALAGTKLEPTGAEGIIESVDKGAKVLTVGNFKGYVEFEKGQDIVVEELDPIGRPKPDPNDANKFLYKAKAKLTELKPPPSWISPEGPYAIGDVIEVVVERSRTDLSKAGHFADIKCNAFGEHGSDIRTRKVEWEANQAFSKPVRIQLMRTTKKPWVELKAREGDSLEEWERYSLRGDMRREFKINKDRYVFFANRHFKTKPSLVLETEASLTVAVSSPAQRDIDVLLVSKAFERNADAELAYIAPPADQHCVPVTVKAGERTASVKVTPKQRFQSSEPVITLRAGKRGFWIALEGDDDAAPKLAKDDTLKFEPATSLEYTVAEVAPGNPASTTGLPHLYLVTGFEDDPNTKTLKKGSDTFVVKESVAQYTFPAKGKAKGEGTLPVELKVPTATFPQHFLKGRWESQRGTPIVGRGEETHVLVELSEACPMDGKSLWVRSFAFGEEEYTPTTGGPARKRGKKVEIKLKQGDTRAQSEAVKLEPPLRLANRPVQVELLPPGPGVPVDVGDPALVKVINAPSLSFPRLTRDDGTIATAPWMEPIDGEVVKGDKARFRVTSTYALSSDDKIAKAFLKSTAFRDVAFDFQPDGGTEKWVEVTVTKAHKGTQLNHRVTIAKDADCLAGIINTRTLRVYKERLVYFLPKPLTLPGEAVKGWKFEFNKDGLEEEELHPAVNGSPAIKVQYRFRLERDGTDYTDEEKETREFPLKLVDEPDLVRHPVHGGALYEVERPEGRFVPGDKPRLSVYLKVAAPEGGASVTISGGPVKGSVKAEFKQGQQLLHEEVELGPEDPKPQPVNLSAPSNCKLGHRKKYKLTCYRPKVEFATPAIVPKVLRANTLAWIHIVLDQPAPYLGCTVKVKWVLKDTPATEKYPYQRRAPEGDPLPTDLLAYVPEGKKSTKLAVRLLELLPEDFEDKEWEVHLEPFDTADAPDNFAKQRCQPADGDKKKTAIWVKSAPKIGWADIETDQKPVSGHKVKVSADKFTQKDGSLVEQLEFEEGPDQFCFEAGTEGKDKAVLWLKPSEEPEEEVSAYIKSKAFGPRTYVVKFPPGKADPVSQEVQFVRGITQNHDLHKKKELRWPIIITPPPEWQAAPDRKRLLVSIQLPPDSKPEQECPLLAGDPDQVAIDETAKSLEPDEEYCNLHRLFLIEEHGDELALNLNSPERGADGKGTFEIVRRADHAIEAKLARECANEPATFQVIAGRQSDPKVDDAGKEFHSTQIHVQLSREDYWCGQQFFEGSVGDDEVHEDYGVRMHPFLTVEEQVDKHWIPVLGKKWKPVPDVPRCVRGTIQPTQEELEQAELGQAQAKLDRQHAILFTFPVYQAHHFWHQSEYDGESRGVLKKLGKGATWVGNKIKEINPVDNLLSLFSFLSWKPKLYRVRLESCGSATGADKQGPIEALEAHVQVYPSDEFCLSYEFNPGWEHSAKAWGHVGKYYDGKEGKLKDSSEVGGSADDKAVSVSSEDGVKRDDDVEVPDDFGGIDLDEGDEIELEDETRPGAFLLEHCDRGKLPEPPEPPKYGQGRKPSLVFHEPGGDDDDGYNWGGSKHEADFESDLSDAEEFWGGDKSFGEEVLGWEHNNDTITKYLEGGDDDTEGFTGKLALTRNGQGDPAYDAIANSIYAIILATRTIVDSTTDMASNFRYAYGFGVQCHVKFLEGVAQAYWGFKEAEDHRVFRWFALHLDMTLIDAGVGVTFGAHASALLFKFEAVAYFNLSIQATLKLAVEKSKPGLSLPQLTENWIGVAARVEGGLNIVLFHENVFRFNAAIKSGLKVEFRVLNMDKNPFGIEYRGFFLGVSFSVTCKVIGFKERGFEFFVVRPSSPDFPLFRGTFPRKASKGFGFLRNELANAWKLAAKQRGDILGRLEKYQNTQLYMVRNAKVHTVVRTDDKGNSETVSKFLKTEELPSYKCDRHPAASDYRDAVKAWEENKALWDEQWEKCREGFSWEDKKAHKRYTHWPVDLTNKLNSIVGTADRRWGRLEVRLKKLDDVLKKCEELTNELDDMAQTTDSGDCRPEKAMVLKVKRVRKDPLLNWEKKTDIQIGKLRHPLLRFDDVCKDLLYYAKQRKFW